jgi:hypothetical protein
LGKEDTMGGLLRLTGGLATAPTWGEEVVIKYYGHWRRFVDNLRRREARPPARGAIVEDIEMFEVRCAEGDARVEFEAAMEVWAGRIERQPHA